MNESLSILIVEDDIVSLKILEKSLVKAGYRVVSAKNGREALDILTVNFIPIVITDWMMPEMDGPELTRAIRERDFPGYIFIILVTARDSNDDIITGLEAGADDYMSKPFNKGELLARLKACRRILELESSLKSANEKIKILSINDPLTGIYNRGYMNERLPQEIARAKRYGHPLSLIMCDIDHFKMINDSYGHQAGDDILRKFVANLKNAIRYGIDWMVRYGGEEFLIVLPETRLTNAFQVAERLRALISRKIFTIHDKEIRVTASFGITGFESATHNGNVSSEMLIGKADKCLYRAKKEGRNRVEGARLDDIGDTE